MPQGTLTLYNASAGSGKTYTLTAVYLSSLFRSRYNYRKILAVTFTNKATAEMKSRILGSLFKLSSGQDCDYLQDLMFEGNRTEEWVRKEPGEILNAILHDFSRFNVSTIDSFFQKVLRAFTREAGLHTGYSIELDHSRLLAEAVESVIASAADDTSLRRWLITYALANIEDEKSWNLKQEIVKLGQELFSEKFRMLCPGEKEKLGDKEFLHEYILRLRMMSSSFEKKMQDYGKDAEAVFLRFGLTDEMFFKKGLGVPKYIRQLASGSIVQPNDGVESAIADPPRWSTKSPDPKLMEAVNAGLGTIISEAVRCYNENIVFHTTAGYVLSNIYALGILSDVSARIHELTTLENRFLLSDAGEFLTLITAGDQCPFIYEKTGNRFENFMIDEFQDTSMSQWSNFRPLIDNSMAQGSDNLVVGDVKQSIYRWRNSDWRILGRVLAGQVDNKRVFREDLVRNFRSCERIIKFNNSLFSALPAVFDRILEQENLPESFTDLYSGAVQTDPGKRTGGYVRLEFLENEDDSRWQEKVLKKIPEIIEKVQDNGYLASDIGIIVRDNREGALVLESILDYSASVPAEMRERYNYNVVSNDSLLLTNAPVVNFIISVLSVLNDHDDSISRAAMLRTYLEVKGIEGFHSVPFTTGEERKYFPAGYEDILDGLKQLPLFEAVESIIHFFSLGENPSDTSYLNTIQDHILSFAGEGNAGLRAFLEWWDSDGQKKSVVLSGNQEAIRILTIHKSKGLEYPVVILPFLSWDIDHPPFKQPLLWVRPSAAPFNELGVVPVRYCSGLTDTIFAGDYHEEKYSIHLDNLNLVYVAFTRARDALYAFSVANPRNCKTIATVLRDSLESSMEVKDGCIDLASYFDRAGGTFEYGTLPGKAPELPGSAGNIVQNYTVSRSMGSLRLKLHGENYFSSGDPEIKKKINYGKLMHAIFEGINIPGDIPSAVKKMTMEGRIPTGEAAELEKKVMALISAGQVAEWFSAGNSVMKEAGILLPAGNIRRPDRVIFRDGITSVIDFKFGEENIHHSRQVKNYMDLLTEMGYENVKGYVWYADRNIIVTV